MANKKFTREEYERITKENMELFAKLDRQIAEERAEKEEFLSTLSEEEQAKYLWEEDRKINAEAAGKFKNTVKIVAKKEELLTTEELDEELDKLDEVADEVDDIIIVKEQFGVKWQKGEWNGYTVYDGILPEPAIIGQPRLILVKDNKARASTADEAFEYYDYLESEK